MELQIRYWREKRKMKLRELAQRSGVSYPMLSAYEIGTNPPPLPKLFAIAKALGITVHDLLPPQEHSAVPEETALTSVASEEG